MYLKTYQSIRLRLSRCCAQVLSYLYCCFASRDTPPPLSPDSPVQLIRDLTGDSSHTFLYVLYGIVRDCLCIKIVPVTIHYIPKLKFVCSKHSCNKIAVWAQTHFAYLINLLFIWADVSHLNINLLTLLARLQRQTILSLLGNTFEHICNDLSNTTRSSRPSNNFVPGHYQQSFQPSEQPIQRYMAESDQMGPLRGSQMYQRSISNAVASVPHTAVRMDSPTPSMYSHGITISSNATSPVGENDLIYDSAAYSPHAAVYDYNSYSQHSHSGNHFLHDLTINNDAAIPQYALPPNASYNCVNMSQVQGFADLQDVYGTDEGYGGLAMQGSSNDYIEVAHQNFKSEEGNSYRYSTDEGLGTSIQDSASHAAASPVDNSHDEIDADGEDDASAPPSPASDTDYAPRSKATRGSARKAKRTRDSIDSFGSPQSAKRARTAKNPKALSQANTTKNGIPCSQCPDSFPSTSLLSKHTLKEHTKAFTCVFSFAGCSAVFATKNEWKRHVYSQHCNFFTWTCDIGDCTKPSGKKSSSVAVVGSNFNRKDLYTQHLRRMHTPKAAEKGGKNSPGALAWDERIKVLQEVNCHQTRNPPTELNCPVHSCSVTFSGKNTWDERMEHVGKHLESLAHARGGAGNGGREVVNQGSDQLLVDWAVREGVVVPDPSGEGYCFPGDAARRRVEFMAAQQGEGEDSEDDAEGEDE